MPDTDDKSKTQSDAPKPGLSCPAENCNKELKSNQTLKNHMVRFHDGVIQPLKNMMSPKGSSVAAPYSSPGPSSASSAASAPSSAPTPTPASTSSPPAAPTTAPTENELEKEMEVLLEAVREEKEVFEALEKITQDVITPELEKETRDNLIIYYVKERQHYKGHI